MSPAPRFPLFALAPSKEELWSLELPRGPLREYAPRLEDYLATAACTSSTDGEVIGGLYRLA